MNTQEPAPRCDNVRRLLCAAAGRAVTITRSEALTEERSVWRCTITDGPPTLSSVIVRTHRQFGGWRTGPAYLFNDYAATTFLNEWAADLTPRVIAADLAAGIQITEDLGPGPSLGDILAGSDPDAAVRAINAYAHALGSMHARSAGREALYYGHRRALGPIDPAADRVNVNERSVPAAIAHLTAAATAAGRPPSSRARADLAAVENTLTEPGEFLALSGGDPCPYNCIINGDYARFFDFELAGYRHALLDAAYLHLGFHACYRSGRLPDRVLHEAVVIYRQAAGTRIRAMLADTTYRWHLAAATAAAALLALARATPEPGVHEAPSQERINQAGRIIELHALTHQGNPQLPALTTWLRRLRSEHNRFQAIGEEPSFPAFRCRG